MLNLLPLSALGQEGFVLELEPVPFPFDEGPRETEFIHLKVTNQDGFNDPEEDCAGSERGAPFGNQGTLVREEDVSVPWKIRLVNVEDYYIKMIPKPSEILISLSFGSEASQDECDLFRPSMELSAHEKYGEDQNQPIVELGCNYMMIEYELSANADCQLFGTNYEGDIEFTIKSDEAKPLRKGNYVFEPCLSYMKMVGVNSVQFKLEAEAPGRDDGRDLEGEGTCFYCPIDNPNCPCCHFEEDDADDDQKLKEIEEMLQALEADTSDQEPSSVVIAAVSLGAIATALGLVNLVILLSRGQS